MAGSIVEFQVRGAERLIAGFDLLPAEFQRKVVRKTTRGSAKRLKQRVVENLSGKVVQPRTGRWLAAAKAVSVRSRNFRRGTGLSGHGFATPTRAEIGVDPEAKGYYPFAVEFGSPHMPAKAPIRRAVNDVETFEHATMLTELRKGVVVQARKVFAR